MTILCSILLGFLSLFGTNKVTSHYQVVDDHDQPIEGVKVDLSWQCFAIKNRKIDIRNDKESVVTDAKGRVSIQVPNDDDIYSGHIDITAVAKDGYIKEDWMNPDFHSSKSDGIHPKNDPFKIVLRRLNEEKDVVFPMMSYAASNEIFIVESKPTCSQLACSLLAPDVPHGPGDYIDFFVKAKFDEIRKDWNLVFWTTNDTAGLIATTNRVYVAPETGYVKSMEVGPEVYDSKAFTLYLRTGKPEVYAMVFHYRHTKEIDLHYAHGGRCLFKLADYRVNPFGGRIMEKSIVGDSIPIWEFYYEDALMTLRDKHRYPPYPMVEAMTRNIKRRGDLRSELSSFERVYLRKEREKEKIVAKMKAVGSSDAEIKKSIKSLEQEIKDARENADSRADEINRLKAELQTLYLSEPPAYTRHPKTVSPPPTSHVKSRK